MFQRRFVRCEAAGLASLFCALAAASAAGPERQPPDIVPFDSGRFISEAGEVHVGLFSSRLVIDNITIGEATFRANLDELVEPASVRIYVDREGTGRYQLLTDEELASGERPVSFAFGRDVAARSSTALDVMQGLDLSRMLLTDGSAAVRVDVLLSTPLRDSRPGEPDLVPEVLLLGSFRNQWVRIAAIGGGNVDEPIFVTDLAVVDPLAFEIGRTGVSILVDRFDRPLPISIVGLDLYSGLGMEEGGEVIGYRLEIDAGAPVMFNLLGAGKESQRALAMELRLIDEPEDFFELAATIEWDVISASGGFGLAMAQPFGSSGFVGGGGGFGGGGGGGGGSPGRGFPTPPNGGNGNGGNGDNGNGNGDPVIPGPGSIALLLLAGLVGRGRRRRQTLRR